MVMPQNGAAEVELKAACLQGLIHVVSSISQAPDP